MSGPSHDDDEVKRQIREELGRAPAPTPAPRPVPVDKDAELKRQIKTEMAAGIQSKPAKTQAERDEEVKRQIKSDLKRGPSLQSKQPPMQADKDAELKRQIKAEIAAGTQSKPAKTQAERDEEVKRQIKSDLKRGPSLQSKPPPMQADKDAEIKRRIKAERAAGTQSKPAKTQAERDEEAKRQIKSELNQGQSPQSKPSPTQADKDAELKRQIKAEIGAVEENTAASNQNELSHGDKNRNGQTEAATDDTGDNTTTRNRGRGARRNQADADERVKAQIVASLDAERSNSNLSGANPDSEMELGDYAHVGDNLNRLTVASAAPSVQVEAPEAALAGQDDTSDSVEKGSPASVPDGERPGAFSMQTRAGGGMPAWVRAQAAQNREASNARSGDSNLPPEMRGLQVDDQSNLPPEMRTMIVAPCDESFPEADPEVPAADIVLASNANAETKGRKKIWIYAGFLVVVAAVVGVALGVKLGRDDGAVSQIGTVNDSPTQSPTAFECPPAYELFDNDIENVTETTMRYLKNFTKFFPEYAAATNVDLCSPLHLALVWLDNDNSNSTHSDETRENRFLLSLIFFKTNGKKWRVNNAGWQTESAMCSWAGVLCDESENIIELDLGDQIEEDIEGDDADLLVKEPSIPSEFGFFTDLRE
jgi:hypothetical protein